MHLDLRLFGAVGALAFALISCGPSSRPAGPWQPLPPTPQPVPSPPAASDEPVAHPPAAPPPSRVPWRANEDPADNQVEAPPEPFAECEALLEEHHVSYRKATQSVRQQTGTNRVCGVEQAIGYLTGPEKIEWNSPVVMSCGLGIALGRLERLIAEEARRHFGHGVKRVLHGAPFQCRKISGSALPSEHSYANAIDIFGFVLDTGRTISVSLQFGATTTLEGTTPEAKFLRAVSRRAFDEGLFSTVLTPYFNADHQSHFHLDLGRYRANGTK